MYNYKHRRMHFFILLFVICPLIKMEGTNLMLLWGASEEKIYNFRTFADILKQSDVSHEGIERHFISGSGQFCPRNISQLSKAMKKSSCPLKKVIIVDLRLESHGFINDIPVSWTALHNDANVGKSLEEVFEDEQTQLKLSSLSQEIDGIPIYEICTEKELIEKLGWEYIRLPFQDHYKPGMEIVAAFLKLIQNNRDAWIHVHCAGGQGRTTVFLSLYDIFHNAGVLTLDDILERQKANKGQDLQRHLLHPHQDPYRQQMYTERLEFVENFYQLRLEQLFESDS